MGWVLLTQEFFNSTQHPVFFENILDIDTIDQPATIGKGSFSLVRLQFLCPASIDDLPVKTC